MAKSPIILAVLGVALALLGTQISRTISENKKTRFDGSFESVAPDLWREGYHWVAMGTSDVPHASRTHHATEASRPAHRVLTPQVA